MTDGVEQGTNRRRPHGGEGRGGTPLRILLIALILAVVATYTLQLYVERKVAEATGGAPVEVLLAAQAISAGTELTEDLVRSREIPSAYVHPRTVTADQKAFVLGQKALEDIAADEALLWTDLMLSSRTTLTDKLGFGERAITIGVDAFSSQHGQIQPGDRVDVLCNLDVPGDDLSSRGSETRLLLQNVLILAVDGSTSRDPAFQAPSSGIAGLAAAASDATPSAGGPSTVTLKLTARDARVLAFAEENGRVLLLLRNPSDVIVEPPVAVTLADLARLPAPTPPRPASASPSAGYPTVFEQGVQKGSAYFPPVVGSELRALLEAMQQSKVDLTPGKEGSQSAPAGAAPKSRSGDEKAPKRPGGSP